MSPRQIFVINSQEELKKIFYKEETVPEIDFSTHTLIIGYHPFGGTTGDKYPTSLKKQELYKTETGYTLLLYTTYDIYGESYIIMQESVAFWGIYPKLSDEPVDTRIKYENK